MTASLVTEKCSYPGLTGLQIECQLPEGHSGFHKCTVIWSTHADDILVGDRESAIIRAALDRLCGPGLVGGYARIPDHEDAYLHEIQTLRRKFE